MRYSITITTSSHRAAGTDAAVSAMLHGRDGSSAIIALDKYNVDVSKRPKAAAGLDLMLFVRSAVDTFRIAARRPLGPLTGVTLSLTGSDGDVTWLPARLTVRGEGCETSDVLCGSWLDANDTEGGASRLFSVRAGPAPVRATASGRFLVERCRQARV